MDVSFGTTDYDRRGGRQGFLPKVAGWARRTLRRPAALHLFTAGTASVGGLMDLRKKGRNWRDAKVDGICRRQDVDAMADRLKRLGGAVYVPPPTATSAALRSLPTANCQPCHGHGDEIRLKQPPSSTNRDAWAGTSCSLRPGEGVCFLWRAFCWQRADAEVARPTRISCSPPAADDRGMLTKQSMDPIPFWLFYINVDDIDAARNG